MNNFTPTGLVTFLFTDIEGSTKLWENQPEAMRAAHARHNQILRQVCETHRGYVFKTVGDAFCVAFAEALEAVRAAAEAQMVLAAEPWGEAVIRVRMGLHTGVAEIQADGDYQGYLALSRIQRIMSAGTGGQVLLSHATQKQVVDLLPGGISLRDMGERRLKDLTQPEHFYQLVLPGLPVDFPPLKTLDLVRHNLPAQMTSFIGRQRELAEIKEAVRSHRLVTLTGSGGTGKTRLSVQAAIDLLDQFVDGVWFVELAPLTDPELVSQAILSSMQASEQENRSALDTLIEILHGKKQLILLDNCEHLIEACARTAKKLLENLPDLHILASSREALTLAGELAWAVPSLSIPVGKTVEDPMQYEAVQLFIERASLAQSHFRLTGENTPAILQICTRLDGIPLALELAAARVKALSVEQIAARLDDRFRLLTGGSRAALPRQQTLRALIDWSYNLLSEPEKGLFRRLGVFVGGWTLEAAEQVCGDAEEFDTLDLLTRLVEKSLVGMDASTGQARYRLLETTRQYAREMLLAFNEMEEFRNRHLTFFLELAEHARLEMRGRKQGEWVPLLEADHDNLRSALEWSQDYNPEAGLRMAAALADFWDIRGYVSEARQRLESALKNAAHLPPSPAYVEALLGAMGLTIRQSELEPSRKLLDKGLEMARAIDYKPGLARFYTARGIMAEFFEGDLDKAEQLSLQALEIYRAIGDKLSLGQALGPLASCALKRYDFSRAEQLYNESLSIFREVENEREIAGALENLAEVALACRDYRPALDFASESLSIYQQLDDKHGLATALRALGLAFHNLGLLERARSACEQSAELYREIGDRGCLTLTLAVFARVLQQLGSLEQALTIIRDARGFLDAVGREMVATSVFDAFGRIALAAGDLEQARKQFLDGLEFQEEMRDAHFVPSLLEGLAAERAQTRHPETALRLIGAASALREQTNLPLTPVEQAEYQQTLEALLSQLEAAGFKKYQAEGRALGVEKAIRLALEMNNSGS